MTEYGSRRTTARQQATPEPDESDPEFINNAPYEYEKKGRAGKRGRPSNADGRSSGTKRRRGNKPSQGQIKSQNVLMSIFGQILERQSDTSDDESEDEDNADVDEEDKDTDELLQKREDERTHRMKILKTVPKATVPPPRPNVEHDSETESDSDEAIEFPQQPTPLLPPFPVQTRRQSNPTTVNDSATESDSDNEDMFAPLRNELDKDAHVPGNRGNRPKSTMPPIAKHFKQHTASDSDTEYSDDEDDIDSATCLKPIQSRPAFPRDPSQALIPFVLDEQEHTEVPAPINVFLREYQREGIQFIFDRYIEGKGGVLGDDMGLGKTIQVISFLTAIMKKHNDSRDLDRRRKHVSRLQDHREWREKRFLPLANETWPTCLIIAPSTVVHNWERELQIWGYFEVGIYTGPPEERRPVLNDFKMGRLDVVVTSFDTARGDIDLLSDLPWSVIFVDEAHKLKNPASKVTMSFNQFTCTRRFGLTGTAIQNSYEEMWTLLDWSNPGRLGSLRQWKSMISKPLAVGQSASASPQERALAKVVANILVHKILPLFFLRRTKDLIAHQLPKKIDEVVFCPLTPKQIEVYKRILEHRNARLAIAKANPNAEAELCDCGSGLKRRQCCHVMDGAQFFTYLAIFLKVSNHLALILPSPNDTEEQTKRHREISRIAFAGERVPKYGPAILVPQYCGKWIVLNLLLEEWKKDRTNKVLIFTKSVKLLDMLDYHLNMHSYSFCRLDGSTKQSERMPMIDRFNHDPDTFVFLISTLAGGTGLNLTGANKVVIFDPNWNPAHDLQAMDRAYRYGQTRDVHVYRLLGAGSIEELIYARQVYKQQMMRIGYEASTQTRYFDAVQGVKKGELFGQDNLFKLHEDTLATKMTIEKAHLAEFDWALAHMDGLTKGKKNLIRAEETLKAEAKAIGNEQGELRGLATLLLDEDVPSSQRKESNDEVQQLLSKACIRYTHQNDELLRPSRVEEESLKESIKLLRKHKAEEKRTKENTAGPSRRKRHSSPVMQWPPRRKHHSAPQSPGRKLRDRQLALLDLGFIHSASELPSFATKFTTLAEKEQQRILIQLDQHIQHSK